MFPISNWTELDVWQYIERENIELPSLYYAHQRKVVERKGLLVPVTELTPLRDGEEAVEKTVRFRTVGDITCTCPVDSPALNAADVVLETLAADVSERGATRMDDKTSDASMENVKKKATFRLSPQRALPASPRGGALGRQSRTLGPHWRRHCIF